MADEKSRLDKSDAKYVECIHTNFKCFGFKEPICHADFYPNGGYKQPGCSLLGGNTCDHSRAIEFFEDSLQGNVFKAHGCDKSIELGGEGEDLKKCHGAEVMMGGEPGNKDLHGVFYLTTREMTPFSFYEFSKNAEKSSAGKLQVTLVYFVVFAVALINLFN